MALLVLITAVAAAACAQPASVRGESDPNETSMRQGIGPGASLAAGLGDGTWTLRVDREWDHVSGSIRFPADPLKESDYRPVTEGPTYPVTVTQGARIVSVGDPPMAGTRDPNHSERFHYDLTEGLFAGGRFDVWATDGGLQAELTIYGSGVPIIQSERGAIEPRGEVLALHVPVCEKPHAR